MNQTIDKAALRKQLAALRAAISSADKSHYDSVIGARVLAWIEAAGIGSLGVYWPLRGEPDLLATYGQLAARGVELALPVVLDKDAALGFAAWQPGEAMVKDRMGVAVPQDLRLIARPPALLIPCLGFNGAGFRLGYGGGFYDRTLEHAPRPLTAGVAYAIQQAEFAGAPHDVALDQVITEA